VGRINSRYDIVVREGLSVGSDYKGELRVGLDIANLRKWFLTGFIIPFHRWTVIGLTRNGGHFKVYANGQLVRELYPYQTKGAYSITLSPSHNTHNRTLISS